ncbi:hypothetical protein [Shimia abyssi]|uniref:DUF3887 domain-containing protein n=1 Tax=Shimia abyssi TaxID=1662395 RepID=A0A2P8FCG9_9RHOB|nr:hypothetical protein [Shimia abyssi]PSL19421.1 hypothetical protein CLV88_106134 [Shimia abyssi]
MLRPKIYALSVALSVALFAPQVGMAQTNDTSSDAESAETDEAATQPLTIERRTNQRTSFNEGLAQFNEFIMQGQLGEAIAFLRPDIELGQDEIATLDAQLTELYSDVFTGQDTVRSESLKGGFRQEMLAYWTDKGEYFYVYVLMHSQNDSRRVLHIEYNTEFHSVFSLF